MMLASLKIERKSLGKNLLLAQSNMHIIDIAI